MTDDISLLGARGGPGHRGHAGAQPAREQWLGLLATLPRIVIAGDGSEDEFVFGRLNASRQNYMLQGDSAGPALLTRAADGPGR